MVKEKENLDLIEKKYVLVPPDGGWGYFVAISTIIIFSTTTAFAGCFGMMFNDFIIEISLSSAGVTLLSGIFCISFALAGYFTSALLRIMSMRKLAFAASAVFAIGALGTVIMQSVFTFFIYAGVLQGLGFGIIFNLACTVMNEYFVEKRLLVMSFVQTATGINTMLCPIFVKWSLDQYGSRGTMLLVAGISLQNFIAVFLMQPVKWHMKKVEVPDKTELKLLLEERNDVKKIETPIIKLTDLEGNMKGAQEKALVFPEIEEKKTVVWKIVESLIDTSLIKSFLLSCASIGPAMCNTADGIHMVMTPQYLYLMEWSQENVAMAITLYGFGDLATRIVFTVVSKWMFKLGVQRIYIAGLAIAVMSRLGMLWSSSVISIMVYFTLMGVAHCFIAVLPPLVTSESVPPEKFTSAMGISLLLTGVFSFTLGPVVGAIRDMTNSYSTAFYTLTSFYALIAILWPLELIIKSKRRKNAKSNFISSQINKLSK